MDDLVSCPTGLAESELLTVVSSNDQLTSRLWDFFLSGHMVDFSFCWGCQTVRAHRLVLEAYFSPENLYQYAGNPVVNDIKWDQDGELHSVMEFLYRGQITVCRTRLDGLRQIAKELDLRVLTEAIDTVAMAGACEVAEGGSGGRDSKIIPKEQPESEDISCGIHFDMDVTEEVAQEVEESSAHELERAISSLNPPRGIRTKKPGGSPFSQHTNDDDDDNDKDWEAPESDDSDGSDWLTSTQRLNEAKKLIKLDRCGKMEAEKVSSNRIAVKSQTVAKAMVRSSTITNHVAKPIPAATRIMSGRLPDLSTDAKPFKCDFCRYATALQVNLDLHIAGVHPVNPVMYKCSQCKYESTGKLRYNYHMYTVHGIRANGQTVGKNFKCAECPYAAVNGSQLRNHMLGKHATEKRFKCEHCPYACRRRGSLNAHVRHVHQRQQRFICETCGLRTISQGGLDRHNRKHTGEKPYSCEICGTRFADASSLNKHAMIHRDERPFVCHVCGRAFSRRSNLKVHLKNVHKTEPEAS